MSNMCLEFRFNKLYLRNFHYSYHSYLFSSISNPYPGLSPTVATTIYLHPWLVDRIYDNFVHCALVSPLETSLEGSSIYCHLLAGPNNKSKNNFLFVF